MIIEVSKIYTDMEFEQYEGSFFDESYYDVIYDSDIDIDCYNAETNGVLFKIRKKAISDDMA
jgi:hypothetical protein